MIQVGKTSYQVKVLLSAYFYADGNGSEYRYIALLLQVVFGTVNNKATTFPKF